MACTQKDTTLRVQHAYGGEPYPMPDEVKRLTGYSPTPLPDRHEPVQQNVYYSGYSDVTKKRSNRRANHAMPVSDAAYPPSAIVVNPVGHCGEEISGVTWDDSYLGYSSDPETMIRQTYYDNNNDIIKEEQEEEEEEEQDSRSLDDGWPYAATPPLQLSSVGQATRLAKIARMKTRRKCIQRATAVAGGAMGLAVFGPVGAFLAAGGGYAAVRVAGKCRERKFASQGPDQHQQEGDAAGPAVVHGPTQDSFAKPAASMPTS